MGAFLSLVHIGIISLTLQPNSILHIAYHDYILKKEPHLVQQSYFWVFKGVEIKTWSRGLPSPDDCSCDLSSQGVESINICVHL